MGRQDELNLALWLATWVGKMELSCLLRIRVLSHKENSSEAEAGLPKFYFLVFALKNLFRDS